MILYNLKSQNDVHIITKFTDDLNVEAYYVMQDAGRKCTCPAASRDSCRHRQMFRLFDHARAIDTDWFYCFEDGTWHQPFGEPALDEPQPTEPLVRVDVPNSAKPASWRRL